METKVVLLNGPPDSGKDTIAEHLCSTSRKFVHKEFKEKLFELVKVIYSVSDQRFAELYIEKETPCEEYHGISPRQAMIKVSEEVIKPIYGHRYFGDQAARSLIEGKVNIFSDSGFVDEAESLIDEIGKKNILLVQISGRGNFNNDSRNYLPESLFTNVSVVNNTSTLASLFETVSNDISCFLGYFNE